MNALGLGATWAPALVWTVHPGTHTTVERATAQAGVLLCLIAYPSGAWEVRLRDACGVKIMGEAAPSPYRSWSGTLREAQQDAEGRVAHFARHVAALFPPAP